MDPMEKSIVVRKVHEAGWELIPIWMLSSAVGWVLAAALGSLINQSNSLWVAFSGMAGGLVLGVTQWLALRRYLRGAGWWVLATAAGYGVGLPMIGIAGALLDGVFHGPALWAAYGFDFALGGLVVGITQFLYLAGHVRKPGWWLAGSALGWAAGWLAVLGTNLVNSNSWAYFATVGGVYGLVSGATLMWVLGERRVRTGA